MKLAEAFETTHITRIEEESYHGLSDTTDGMRRKSKKIHYL